MYSTLTALKAFLLPKPLQSRTDYDTALQTIGEGVADAFDKHCKRKLRRAEGDAFIFSGDRSLCILQRYPVETITQVETRDDYGSSFVVETGRIEKLSAASGLVVFNTVGSENSQVKVTYTGGYFVDLTGSDTLPAGATAMPRDLRLAWQLQCKHVFDTLDKDGESFRDADRGLGGALVSLLEIDLLESVSNRLHGYKRQSII